MVGSRKNPILISTEKKIPSAINICKVVAKKKEEGNYRYPKSQPLDDWKSVVE